MRCLAAFVVASLAVSATVFDATPSHAGETAPISSLPTLPTAKDRTDPPKDYGVPGLVIKEESSAGRSYFEARAVTAQGYCIASSEFGLRLASTSSVSSKEDELWRLVEKDGKATFERTRYEVASSSNSAWVKSKTQIELRAVAHAHGVTVWGYREPSGDIVLLAHGATGGRQLRPKKADEDSFSFVSSDCAFGATRLHAQEAKNGTFAQITGSLPAVGEGKSKVIPRFAIDSSLAKLARDPEPVLSVRVRVLE
jgi:hypothetical protein